MVKMVHQIKGDAFKYKHMEKTKHSMQPLRNGLKVKTESSVVSIPFVNTSENI